MVECLACQIEYAMTGRPACYVCAEPVTKEQSA